MSRKNNRDRQKRLQRKRNKRNAQRASRRPGAGAFGGYPFDDDPFGPPVRLSQELIACIGTCEELLGDAGPMPDEVRQEVTSAAKRAGGVWLRLPFELEAFLYEGASWSLTCADLEPVRDAFEENSSDECFARLWALALTNEPDPGAFLAARAESCAHRAALAFLELRECLNDPARDTRPGLEAVAREIEGHEGNAKLRNAYRKLLLMAIACVRATADEQRIVAGLVAECQKVLNAHSSGLAHTAWWQCTRVFLAEVLARLGERGFARELAAQPALITQLLGGPAGSLWLAQHGASDEPLRAVHFSGGTAATEWLSILRQRVDPRALSFEDRLRYQIARLKLLRAQGRTTALTTATDNSRAEILTRARELLQAFDEMRAFLAHGVPPASRALPEALEPSLMDFYVDSVSELRGEGAALQTSLTLLERHPHDFRLACLYATGALVCGQRERLDVLRKHELRAHVDPQLFAHYARTWTSLPHGKQAAAAVRPLLFDRLDREHRKQCLIQLAQHALRRATHRSDYDAELRRLLPFFERNNFVQRELGEGAALESALVFLATMMATLHGTTLALTESQSQQWVSYAQEIARQFPVGAELAVHYLRTPSRAFVLTPAVRSAARARIADFRPATALMPAARTASREQPRRRKRRGRGGRTERPRDDQSSSPDGGSARRGEPRRSESPGSGHQQPQPEQLNQRGLFDGDDA